MDEQGITRTEDGGVFCAACGNDLKKDGAAKFVAHMDGRACYTNVWECRACGASITQTVARSAEDAFWWAE